MKRLICLSLALLFSVPAFTAQRLPTNRATILAVGPFVDYSDGVSPETAMTVTNITCELYKMSDAGGAGTAPTRTAITLAASGTANDMVHITSDVGGYYSIELTAAQLNFVGRAKLCFTDPDVMAPVWEDLIVEPNNVYDSDVSGTDKRNVDVESFGGTAYTDVLADKDEIVLAFGDGSELTAAGAVLTTTVASATSDTEFVLTAGFAVESAYKWCIVTVTDATTSLAARRLVITYGADRKVVVDSPLPFTPAAGDTVTICDYFVPVLWGR